MQINGRLISTQDGEDFIKFHMKSMMISIKEFLDHNIKWNNLLSNGHSTLMLELETKVLHHTLECIIQVIELSTQTKFNMMTFQTDIKINIEIWNDYN